MVFVPGRAFSRLLFLCGVVATVGLLGACGGEPEEPEVSGAETPDSEEVAEVEEQEEAPPVRPFLPVAMARSTSIETFAHDAHAEIQCLECHQSPPGHESHRDIDCSECHRNSATATRGNLTRGDCLACHHASDREVRCTSCHESVPPMVVTRTVDLAVSDGPQSRRLPFDHVDHEEGCSTCHTPSVGQPVDRSCASCHEYHHRPVSDCAACHGTELLELHDLDAHLTCSSSSCHSDPVVEAMSLDRTVCLACHQDQRDHRPNRDCAECHELRPSQRPRLPGPAQMPQPLRFPAGGFR